MTYICDVHYTVYIITRKTKILFKNIFHNIGAKIADVGIVINSRTAGVHINLAGCVRYKFLLCLSERII